MSSELEDAARRLRALTDTIKPPRAGDVRSVWVTSYELDAIIYAAAFLGVFAEAIEAQTFAQSRPCPIEGVGIIEMGACTVCGYVPEDAEVN